MYSDLFTAESLAELKTAFLTQFPMALWETFYVTVLSTALAILLGLPLGVLLVAGEKDGVLPLPKPVLSVLNVIINLLRSIPFLILMIMVFPLSRLIIGTAVGTTATIVPLVVAAFPFVARLVESSLREVDPNIIEAARITGAEAIHPGYGFLSENAHFASLCRRNGLVFIGPTPESMEALSDKAGLKDIMKINGLEVIPGTQALPDVTAALNAAAQIGYPVMLKASAGGGGRGIRLVQLEENWQLVSAPRWGAVIRGLLARKKPDKLSASALETLALVAYFQPVTRVYLDQARGVDSAHSLGVLLDRELVEPCGTLLYIIGRNTAGHQSHKKIIFIIFFPVGKAETANLFQGQLFLFRVFGSHCKCDSC